MLLALLLALCPPTARVAPDWISVRDETGAYELRLPKTLKRPEEQHFFVHGGEVWKDEHTLPKFAAIALSLREKKEEVP